MCMYISPLHFTHALLVQYVLINCIDHFQVSQELDNSPLDQVILTGQ